MPSSNPLWFGYYPGDPIPIAPKNDRRLPTPELNLSDLSLTASLDDALSTMEAPLEAPAHLWEAAVEDFKYQFLAASSPYLRKGEDMYAYGKQEAADVKGVYIGINLLDLVTDPKKTAEKFLKDSLSPLNPFGRGGLDNEFFRDVTTNAEMSVWRELLDAKAPGGAFRLDALEKTMSPSPGRPLNFLKQNIHRFDDKEVYSATRDAAHIGKGIVIVKKDVDVYEQAKFSTIAFVAGKSSAFTRNEKYFDMQRDLAAAVSTELKQKDAALVGALAGRTSAGELIATFRGFSHEGDIALGLSKMGGALSDMEKLTSQAEFTKSITLVTANKQMGKVDKAILETKAAIRSAKAAYATDAHDALLKFEHAVAPVEAYIRELEGFSTSLGLTGRLSSNLLGTLAGFGESEKIATQIRMFNSTLNTNRFDGGIADIYVKSIGKRSYEGEKSLLAELGDLVDPITNAGVMSEGFQSIGVVYNYQKRMFLQDATRDLAKQISKGQLEKSYLWFGNIGELVNKAYLKYGNLKDRVQVYTPGYWAGKVLKRTHYFGLKYDPKVKVIHPWFDKNPLIITNRFTEHFTVTIGGVTTVYTAKLQGSAHLGSFFDAWQRAQKGHFVGSVNAAGIVSWGNVDQNMQAYFDLLNGKTVAAGMDALMDKDDVIRLTNDFAKMRADLKKAGLLDKLSKDASGNFTCSPENKAILGGLFERLKLRDASGAHINSNIARIGLLQWYVTGLSQLQQNIITKLRLNKLITGINRLKLEIEQKVAKFIAKFAGKIAIKLGLTAITGGLATLLAPLLEKFAQFVVAKLYDAAKDLLSAILKGDLSRVMNKFFNETMALTQKALTCGCFVPVFLVFAAMFLFSNILSSISPIDRAKQLVTAVYNAVIPPRPPDIDDQGNCVGPTYTITALSYLCANEPPVGTSTSCASVGTSTLVSRHGSNYYYAPKDSIPYNPATDGLQDCSLTIPYFRGTAKGPVGDADSWCSGATPAKSFYGYAMDVVPGIAGGASEAWVYAPKLPGVDKWTFSNWGTPSDIKRVDDLTLPRAQRKGCWITLHGESGGVPSVPSYTLHFLHLECASMPDIGRTMLEPGKPVARLYDYVGGKHVHIELQVDNVYKKPEEYLCTH